ncbi:MAG TPA: hypothetical protein VF710_15075 [Longimicrobium sp.]
MQEFGTVRLAPTGIVIPRDMWVRVRVSGSVRIDADPEWVRRFCNPGPPSECPPPYDGASAGPLGVNDGLEVQVAMNNAYFLWRPRASGGDGAEDIMWVSAGTSVLAGRAGLWEFGDCWACTHEPGRAGRYRLTGTQTLTVEEINPLSVRADRTETDPGEPVGFTARADEEMRNLEWAFVPGDTLPESEPAASLARAGGASFSLSAAAAAPAADWDALASCRRKEACTTRVAVSGRMWVRGHIEDQIVFAKSEIVRVQPVRLKLDCTPNPVTRGQSITCTASKDPASTPGELKITGWSFADMDGHTITRASGSTSLTWSGIMVVGGTMHVSGTVGQQQHAARADVQVSPRADWSVNFPATPVAGKSEALPYPPVTTPGVGSEGVFGRYTYDWSQSALRGGTGPNSGWYFFRGPPEFDNARIHVNPALYPDDPFYRAQNGGTSRSGHRYCDRRFMESAREFVEQHELRHHEIARQFWTGAGVAMAEGARYYHPEGALSADAILVHMTTGAVDALTSQQAAFDNTSKLEVTCEFKLLPAR